MFYVVSVWLFSRHYISSSVCLDCMLRMRIEVSLPASPWCFVNTKLHDDCIGLKVSSSTLFRFILLALGVGEYVYWGELPWLRTGVYSVWWAVLVVSRGGVSLFTMNKFTLGKFCWSWYIFQLFQDHHII